MFLLDLLERQMTPTSNPSISGDDLSELKRYVLEASRKILVENVDAPRFLPYFRSRFVLDQRECDQIKSCSRQSRYDGAEKLLDVLLTKGSLGYDHFCAAIMYDRTQMFLLTTLNKRLEILRDWRKKQVVVDHHMLQAQAEMQQRIQQQANRQQMYTNRTYPMTTLSSARYHQPGARLPPYQHHLLNPAPPTQERLARSPVPSETEPLAENGQFPNPPCHHDNYHVSDQEFQQFPQQPYHHTLTAHPIIQHPNPVHPVVQHPHLAQPVPQHTHLGQPIQQSAQPSQACGYSYESYYPSPPGQYVPPPAPVGVDYQLPIEGRVYQEHFTRYNDPLILNTPSGARMENLFPGMPPSPSSGGQPASQNCHDTKEDELDRFDGGCVMGAACHPGAYSLRQGTGGISKDILCGQEGN